MQAYRADAVFDGEGLVPGAPLILVANGRIVSLEPAAPDGCEVIELPGTTALPGLIDAHVHLCGDSGTRALDQLGELDQSRLAEIIAGSGRAHVAAGITTVRDLGDANYATLAHRHDADIPTVVAAGPPITTPGGHCAVMGGAASGIDELRAAVRDRADRGVDVVKVMTSGGVMTPDTDVTACQFTLDELRAVVTEAHRLGLPVTGHAHALSAVQMCADAGVDGIEHCSCLTADGVHTPPELIEKLAAARMLVCPTLGHSPDTELPPRVQAVMERLHFTLDDRIRQIDQLYRGGVVLISGSDSGINPGKPHGVLIESLFELASAGMPTRQVLTSATSRAADAIGLGSSKGRLRPQFDADLVFVTGNPLQHLTTLRSVRHVVLRGRPIASGVA